MIESENSCDCLRADFIRGDLVEVIYDSVPHSGLLNYDGMAPLLTAELGLASKATQPVSLGKGASKI